MEQALRVDFRPNVAALVRVGDLYLRCLRSRPEGVWQTLQGGIERADSSPQDALMREFREELGVDAGAMRILAQSRFWRRYHFPPGLERPNSHYVGQEQMWFLVELPSLDCIQLDQSDGEFVQVELASLKTLVDQFVSWKLPIVKDFCYEMGLLKPFLG